MIPFFLAALSVIIPPVQADTPNRQPSLASGVSYSAVVFGSGHSVWYARTNDAGKSFSPPQQIADVPALMLGRHRGPRVAITGDTVVVTAISGGDNNGNLFAWRSSDRGTTWSKEPAIVNDEPHAAREGLQNLSVTRNGVLGAVWLDLRAQGTRLYGSSSRDGGRTWSKNEALYASDGGTICQCCHPSISADPDGQFVVMFRNVREGNRDMYAMRWTPGQPPSRVEKQGNQSWNLNACPMDGGGVVVENHQVVSAWRRDHSVMLAPGNGSEKVIGEGKDVALASSKQGLFTAWVSPSGAVMLQTPRNGAPQTLAANGAFPVLNANSKGALAAWENGDSIALQPLIP